MILTILAEHDVRGGENTRRVTFKQSRYGKKGPQRDWSDSIRAHLDEEDIDMGSSASISNRRKSFHQKRGGGNRPGSPAPFKPKRKLMESPTNWFRVTVCDFSL